MDDINTYLFYTFFLLSCLLGFGILVVGKRKKASDLGIDFNKPGVYFFILVYSLIIGLRYNVGRDYVGYTDWFKELRHTGQFPVDNDFGFIWLNEILVNLGLESYMLFIIIAFLQILFLLLSLRKISFLGSWYLYFFFTSLLFFTSLNTMRQTVALFIFMYCIQLFENKKYLYTCLLSILAFSMHKTVIILFVLLPFLKFEWFKNVKIQGTILFLSVFILPVFFSVILDFASPIINLLGYNYYIENLDLMKEITDENNKGDGLSVFLFFFIDLFIIFFYNKLKKQYSSYNFVMFYNIYFVGLILSRVFAENFILTRIADYFISFRVLILAFLMVYIFNTTKAFKNPFIKPIAVVICIAMLLFYYKAIYNNAGDIAPIQFIF